MILPLTTTDKEGFPTAKVTPPYQIATPTFWFPDMIQQLNDDFTFITIEIEAMFTLEIIA